MAAESDGAAPPLETKRTASADSRGVDPWQLTNFSDVSGESASATDLEVSSPPLVLISSRVKGASSLERCVDAAAGAKVVKYPYDQTTLPKMRQMVAATLKGRLALSIALIVHGQPGFFKLCAKKVRVWAAFFQRGGGRGWACVWLHVRAYVPIMEKKPFCCGTCLLTAVTARPAFNLLLFLLCVSCKAMLELSLVPAVQQPAQQ